MAVRIEKVEGPEALAEFVALHDRVYATRPARWPASPLHLPMLLGQTPITQERELRPSWRARAARWWRVPVPPSTSLPAALERRVGHVLLFESLPHAREGARSVLDAACEWFAERGMDAARNGFGLFDTPYTTDAYEALPPSIMRQNPPAVSRADQAGGLRDGAGLRGLALEVTPALMERWQRALDGARRQGFEIVPLRELPPGERAGSSPSSGTSRFERHLGWCPLSPEITALFVVGEPALDTSVFAFEAGQPVGFCFVIPDDPSHALLAPGRALRPAEKLNMLAIGVRSAARGRGVNYAMASYAFLELVKRRLDASLVHARARRQLALAAHGRGARGAPLRELPRLSARAASRHVPR